MVTGHQNPFATAPVASLQRLNSLTHSQFFADPREECGWDNKLSVPSPRGISDVQREKIRTARHAYLHGGREEVMDHDSTPGDGWRANRHVLFGPLPAVELAGCALLLAVFWGYYAQARALPLPLNPIDIGPGGFPLLLAIGTLLAIAAVCVAALTRAFGTVPIESVSIRRPVSVACAVALLVAQATWFEAFGALPSVIVFAAGTAFACGERRIAHLLGVSAALAAFVYGAFVLALAVNLP